MKSTLTPFLTALLFVPLAFAAVPVPPVILTEQGVSNLGLETVMVEESDFETTLFALGRTEVIPENRAVLSSRIPGRVIETKLKIGGSVEKGEPLILLESRQPGTPPPTIWLTAPADGTVISIDSRLGSPVEPSNSLAEFADLKTLYLLVTLPQATAGKIQQGTQAKIHFPIRPDKEYTATLLRHVATNHFYATQSYSRQEDGETADLNTVGVIFTIENPDNQLLPGMNAECSIILEKREGVLSVPREAVQGGPANRHVYIKHMSIPNAFDRVNVQTGLSNNNRIEILDGLLPGDEVVTRGSYSLGFAGAGGGPSLKEALDAAHGHEHNEDGSEKTPDQKAAVETTGGHGHDHQGNSMREIFFMASTGIFAVLFIVVSLRRRQPTDETSELS